jgi:hypothetical protein
MMLTGLALLATASCSDPDDEITTTDLDRLLRPTELELKIFDKTNIKATMDFVNVPDYLDILIEVNDNPLSENKEYKEYRRVTLQPRDFLGSAKDATLSAANTHATFIDSIRNLSYFKDYRVSFIARNSDGKVSNPSTEVATTDGIFKESSDDDRTNTSLTVKWPSEVFVTKVKTMKMNAGTEELVAEDLIEDATKGKFTKTGLDPDTEYIFYIYNGEDCQGRTTITTFPNYTELFAGAKSSEVKDAIDNLPDGYALMLSPSEESNVFIFKNAEEAQTSFTYTLDNGRSLRIFARNTKPVEVQQMMFKLDNSAGLTLENIKFVGQQGAGDFIQVQNGGITGEYKFINLEVEKYKNFFYDNKTVEAMTANLLQIKNCFFHDAISGGCVIDIRKMLTFAKVEIIQNTFANMTSVTNFFRCDYNSGNTKPSVENMLIENNSFYNVKVSNKGLTYIRSKSADNVDFKCDINNNIFEGCKDTYFSQDSKTNGLAFSDNYYKNSDALTTAFSIGQTAYDPSPNSYTGTSAFKNPDKNDFTVKNTTLVNAGVGNSEFVVKE